MIKTLVFILLLLSSQNAFSEELFSDNFDNYSDSPTNHGWFWEDRDIPSFVDIYPTEGDRGSRGLKVTYQNEGNDAWIEVPGDYSSLGEIYIRFYAKSDGPLSSSKFLKIFGLQTGTGYANTTLSMMPYSGTLALLFGQGITTNNDAGASIYLDGSTVSGVTVDVSSSNFIPDDTWRCYELFMKYNTNDNSDGVYKVWIDGVLRLHATNVKNRHNLNTRGIWGVQLGGYTHGAATVWHIWYDDIIISDSYIGMKEQIRGTATLTAGTLQLMAGTGKFQ